MQKHLCLRDSCCLLYTSCMLDLGDGNSIEMFEAKSNHETHSTWEAGTWGHLALHTCLLYTSFLKIHYPLQNRGLSSLFEQMIRR